MMPPISESAMHRTYLFVAPDEKLEVQALGGRWDGDSKRWYTDSSEGLALFAKWLPYELDEDESDIVRADRPTEMSCRAARYRI